jgi:hypothetical protein
MYESMNEQMIVEPVNQNQLSLSQMYESMNEQMIVEPVNQNQL